VKLLRRIATWRWGAVGVGVLALTVLPALLGAVPVGADRPESATALLARIRASATVPFQGYAEASGNLAIPDVPQLGDIPALLGGSTRLRAWYDGPSRWRVDTIKDTGEDGLYAAASGTWLWEFDPGRATLLAGDPPIRLPRAADLLPADLGRRLAAAAHPDELGPLPARRVAGRTALGLRITPAQSDTTVGRVDLWADADAGLPVRVEVTPRGATTPALTSGFQDLRLARPDPAVTAFTPPPGAPVATTAAPDITALIDRFAPYTLPDRLAGQARREVVTGVPRGVATYGEGYALFAVLPLTNDVARGVLRRLAAPPATALKLDGVSDFDGSAISTPLINAVAFRAGRRYYLLAGLVDPKLLQRAATELATNPPPRRAP
jgi:hypothetical protein